MNYDFIIIGMGGAGGHLIAALAASTILNGKRLLVIDKSKKNQKDRTWCFWEKGKGRWEDLIEHSWQAGVFKYENKIIPLSMEGHTYKMIPSDHFYTHINQIIDQHPSIDLIQDHVVQIAFENQVLVHTTNQVFATDHVFDSRIDPSFDQAKDEYLRVLQHFTGWTIQTNKAHFNPNEFVMMDYTFPWKDHTSFFYILPVSSNKALIEFTLFDTDLLKEEEYNQHLKSYVEDHLNIQDYEIIETEQGIIPMSNYPFHHENNAQITKIGTAGSWVRPSSGYMFKNAEKYAQKIVENLKADQLPSKGFFRKRDFFFDRIFLEVLQNQNHLGPEIFHRMYTKNSTSQIFKFLDGETNMLEEFKIISKFQYLPFLKALYAQYFRR